MPPTSIHQVIHGYREGHRLLSSSLPLNADAARTMLILSDMSGPAMQPGFDEYLTGYPLPGTELFVFAKTWYAPEMQRPGCVWTHSLVLSREQVSQVSASRLLASLRRPQQDGVESAAMTPIGLDSDTPDPAKVDGFGDTTAVATLIGAVLGQSRPVIVTVETAAQLEPAFLRLWEELWPAARTRFSFCTGALMPRSVAGSLMDLQAVPRAIPSSQFRKSAGAALVLDLRTPATRAAWVDLVLDGARRGDATFRSWLETAAGSDASRGVVPSLVPIFGEWHAMPWSARSALASIVNAKELDSIARGRLLGMVFDRAGSEEGVARRRELLQDLCGNRDAALVPMAAMLEEQTRRLFEESRAEGVSLVLSLLGGTLSEVGERVLRAAVLLLVPNDFEGLGDAPAQFLPTIVGANPTLAQSPVIWKRVGSRATEMLSQLSTASLSDEDHGGVINALFASGCDVPVDALVRFGGKVAIIKALAVLAAGELQLSWQWRSALSAQPDVVLSWLEARPTLTLRELEFGTRFFNPKANQSRLTKVWQTGIASGVGTFSPRVAAFGLALAFAEANTRSPLLAACFQPAYDAAGSSRIEYEEWEWLREQAPPVSRWRDWDKCERLAAALSRLIKKQNPSLETVLGIVYSRQAIRKVAAMLDDDGETRSYLESLRRAAEVSSNVGTREQREALWADW
ncbi:hypothetical protein [Corallococcus exiguus]|uniref:GAP1-N1 domain-containing protein n=1 Tax=Corallococcus exiguus TaxID=83462 RepID=UPI003DA1EE13